MNSASLGAPHGATPGNRDANPDHTGTPLKRSMIVSLALHAAVIATFAFWQAAEPPARPPVYKVNIVGALQGPKAIGVVDPRPATAPTRAADAPSGLERPELPKPTLTESKAPPKPAPPQATPTPSRTAQAGQQTETPPKPTAASSAPRAGSTDGGRGADVATVRTDGIDFPVPGYINNIRRQVELSFTPDNRLRNRGLVAEVSFLIQRDGSVTEIRVEKTSGVYSFDLSARSAIESVGSVKAFGPLPVEWTDDVLRVYYNFKPEGTP